MPSRLLWFFVGGATATLMMRDRGYRRCAGFDRRHLIANREDQAQAGSSAIDTRDSDSHPAAPRSWGVQRTAVQWEEDRARMQALSSQAADSMAELSEATLDSLLFTVGALKTKLAEYREQRESEEHRV